MLAALVALCAIAPVHTVDQKQLDALIAHAAETKSDCLVVMVDGKVVLDKWFNTLPVKIEAMSATKSVINLAVGMLIKEGKIKGVDQPVSDFFPEYKGGGKEKVTILNLLNHTSGIEARPDTADIYSSHDFVKNALEKPLTSEPGEVFFYNNRAVNLLAGVASKAAKEPVDSYLNKKLFKKLGIKNYDWSVDGAGNPHGMSGFQAFPEDFAKIGEFVWRGGDGLLPDGWIDKSVQPTAAALKLNTACGLLWWPMLETEGYGADDSLFNDWKKVGIRDVLIDKVRPLKGKVYENVMDYYAAIRDQFKDDMPGMMEINEYFTSNKVRAQTWVSSGPVHSYSARGYLGQYLVIVPSAHIVAVRMRRSIDETESQGNQRSFSDFPALIDKLGKSAKAQ